MPIDRETLGAAIKRVRTARGLTQVQLAKASGLSKGGNSIALIEQGKRFVAVDTLNSIASALDIPAACLAILGSRNVGGDKTAIEFMNSLQNLISTVVIAEQNLKMQENAETAKTASAADERKKLNKLASTFRDIANSNRTASKASRKKKSRPGAKPATKRPAAAGSAAVA